MPARPVNLATIRAAVTAALKDAGYLHIPEGRRDHTTEVPCRDPPAFTASIKDRYGHSRNTPEPPGVLRAADPVLAPGPPPVTQLQVSELALIKRSHLANPRRKPEARHRPAPFGAGLPRWPAWRRSTDGSGARQRCGGPRYPVRARRPRSAPAPGRCSTSSSLSL